MFLVHQDASTCLLGVSGGKGGSGSRDVFLMHQDASTCLLGVSGGKGGLLAIAYLRVWPLQPALKAACGSELTLAAIGSKLEWIGVALHHTSTRGVLGLS